MKQQITNWLDATLVLGYDENQVYSQESYNNVGGLPFDPVTLGDGRRHLPRHAGAPCSVRPMPRTMRRTSTPCPARCRFPALAASASRAATSRAIRTYVTAYDQSDGHSKETSVELRFNTNFDGPVNFMLAGYYLKQHSQSRLLRAGQHLRLSVHRAGLARRVHRSAGLLRRPAASIRATITMTAARTRCPRRRCSAKSITTPSRAR